jgi:uncharacterized protein (DUF2384 family)
VTVWQKASTSFSEEKEAKKDFFESDSAALKTPTPDDQIQKSFCAAFFKKRLLSVAFGPVF